MEIDRLNDDMDPAMPVAVDDLVRLGHLVRDLADPEVMREAWS
jgi:hypothetical protein